MNVTVSVSLALAALRKNLLRSGLALVGLVIGVAAVVTMVALGRGAREEVAEEVSSAGTNLVFVRAGNYARGGDAVGIPSGLGKATTLTAADARAISELAAVQRLSPIVDERAPLSRDRERAFAPIVGAGTELPAIRGLDPHAGRFFDEREVEEGLRVAVLGSAVRDALFGAGSDPVGRALRVRDTTFTVIGVVGGAEAVYVPFTSLQELLEIDYLHGITLSTETAGDASRVADEIRRLLRERHGLDDPDRRPALPSATGPFAMKGAGVAPDDFTIRTEAARALTEGLYTPAAALVLASMPRLDEVTSEEMASTLARANETMTFLLASLACVSLVVGGIGIMNVMLLSVTERTMEVGLRMSVGARARDVLLQFLLEAVALSLAGGLLGILAGFLGSWALTALLGWPTYVSGAALGLSFGLAFAVGVVFGYYPAHRASRLDPIAAIRYE